MQGSVSLLNGKVSGIFAEQKSKITYPYLIIKDKNYTSPELAAVMLHEVGHLITYFEYIARVVSTNQVMGALHREISNIDSPDKRSTLFLSLKEVVKLTDEDITLLEKTNSQDAVSAIVVSSMVEESRSELGNPIYDTCSWEQLADDYTTRLQAGRELVSALAKMYKSHSNISFRSSFSYLAFEALKLVWLLLLVMGAPAVLAIVSLEFATILVMVDGFAGGDYDKPGARFTRVRNQIINELKNPKLAKEEISRLNEDLDFISNILEEVNDRRQILEIVFNFISSRGRKHIILQQQLEEIANNELFVKASKFKILN
jgi:hypothetical protein